MKLTYQEIAESRRGVNSLLNLKPTPTAAIGVKLAINARRINEAMTDFGVVQKSLFEEYAEDTEQVTGTLFVFEDSETAAIAAERLKTGDALYTTIQEEAKDDDDTLAIPVDWTLKETLVESYNEAVAEGMFACEAGSATDVLPGHFGASYIFYLAKKEDRKAVFGEKGEEYRKEMEELLAQEVEIRIRVITTEELTRCEDKRVNFVIEPALIFQASFMFSTGEDEDAEPGV